MSTTLTRATFAVHEGETFRIRIDGGTVVELTLVEVSALRPDGDRPFSLLFAGAADTDLRQGTYHLEHDSAGPFDLFLVPVGPDPETHRMRYESIFN